MELMAAQQFENLGLSPIFILISFITFLITIISVVRSKKQSRSVKIVWVILTVVNPIISTIAWFIWGRNATYETYGSELSRGQEPGYPEHSGVVGNG